MPLMTKLPFAKFVAFTPAFAHDGLGYFIPMTVSVMRRTDKQ